VSCVLIVGGTFDPPHRAHRELPVLVARAVDATRVVYVPAARNPLKTDGPIASDAHRLAMLGLVAAAVPNAEVSTVEIDRGGPSYFVDTLATLGAMFGPATRMRFLIGADQAIEFARWKECRRILDLATPAVVLRPPWTVEALRDALREYWDEAEVERWATWVVETPVIDVSATGVRERLRSGASARDLLDADIAEYIRRQGLYEA